MEIELGAAQIAMLIDIAVVIILVGAIFSCGAWAMYVAWRHSPPAERR